MRVCEPRQHQGHRCETAAKTLPGHLPHRLQRTVSEGSLCPQREAASGHLRAYCVWHPAGKRQSCRGRRGPRGEALLPRGDEMDIEAQGAYMVGSRLLRGG